MVEGGEGSSLRFPGGPTPSRVSLAHIASPIPRRLSSSFPEPSRPARRKIAWVSLQGRLVGAEEATTAAAIRGELSCDEAVAWELFSPLQRALVVAAIAAASNRSQKMAQLQRSVEIRDEVLLRMQQKLDNLLEQMNSLPDQADRCISGFPIENKQIEIESKRVQGSCQNFSSRNPLQELNADNGIVPLCKNMSTVLPEGKDIKEEPPCPKEELFNRAQAVTIYEEERRMSDFSWSVTSSVDFQLITLASEQEFYNLQRELEEKDMKTKELSAAYNALKVSETKRLTELEEIVRRKNLVISKLRKDITVLDKQVIEHTRLRRASASKSISSAASDPNSLRRPILATNILYDVSSSSPSSSDPDSPVIIKPSTSKGASGQHENRKVDKRAQNSAMHPIHFRKSMDSPSERQSISPLKGNRKIQLHGPDSVFRQKRLASEDSNRNRSTASQKANYTYTRRRWC